MRKSVSLILALCLLLSLGLCGCKKEASASIVGTWRADVQYSDYMDQINLLLDGAGDLFDFSGLHLVVVLELRADGTYRFYADPDSLDRLLADMREPLKQGLVRMLQENYGMTDEQIRARLEQQGETLDSLVDRYYQDLDRNAMLQTVSGSYRWENGRLYLTAAGDGYYEAELQSGSLRLTGCVGDDDAGLAAFLPLTFRR